jgi:hypothetical protein
VRRSVGFRSEFEEEVNVKVYRCKKCGMELPDEAHLKVHEDVHKHAKSRVIEYGDPEFSKDKLR